MSTTSPLLKMTLQALDENPDTWGTVLNASALQLLEDSISGSSDVDVTAAGDYTLNDAAGGPTASDGARYMILDVNGTPGGARNVIVPTRSKVYLVVNTSDGTVTVKTVAGTGAAILAGEGQWVFCDGVNVQAASTAQAVNAATATLAADSTLLGGVASSAYAQKALAQTFTKGQVTQRQAVSSAAGSLVVDCSVSNAFYMLTTENFTMAAPTNATTGQVFTLAIEQGGGGPHLLSGFAASTFQFAGGTAPVLSTVAGEADYLAFEYVSNLSGGARWWGSQLKNMVDV